MKDINNWQEDVLAQPLVLVDFWASWCAPCKKMIPVFERLEQEYPQLQVVKVDADARPDLVEEFEINSIPTMMLYKNGEHVWTFTGAKPDPFFKEKLTPYL
jgi:hypothetical protein